MNILHLVNHCRHGHGNVHLAVDLACAQAERGDSVIYAGEGGELQPLLLAEGVEHFDLKQRSRRPFEMAASLVRLVRLIRNRQVDVVHAHMMSGALLGYLATRVTGVPLVTTVHNSFDGHSVIMRLGDCVAAVSEAERRALVARGFSSAKVVTILNAPLGGARSRWFAGERDRALPRPSITTVCGLHERKGVDTIIEAFRQIAADHAANLHIVGDGPDRAELERLAQATGFGSRIHFLGSIAEPQTILRSSDIFVLASHAEPLGLVNIEARQAGCAIVASDVGGIPEALDGGRAGILVPARDARGFAHAIRALLDDEGHLATMKAQAATGLERFSIGRLCEGYRDLYDKAARRGAALARSSSASA
jgi:glycosyltransferase involved in cell wall biosynthesis